MRDFLLTKMEWEGRELRLACLFDDMRLTELLVEAPEMTSHVGGVYVGRLESKAKATGGAFVLLGEAGRCFLKDFDKKKSDGGRVLAQVTKDAAGNKQAVATQQLRLAGRYAVVSPTEQVLSSVFQSPNASATFIASQGNSVMSGSPQGNIVPLESLQGNSDPIGTSQENTIPSRKSQGHSFTFMSLSISSKLAPAEKRRLREAFANDFDFTDCTVLLRTEAAAAPAEEIRKEVASLREKLHSLLLSVANAPVGTCLLPPQPFYFRLLEGAICPPDRLLTDLPAAESVLQKLAKTRGLAFAEKRPGSLPYPELYGLKTELGRLLDKCVHLRCGAELIIQPTEAFVSVDVNSAHFRGAGSPERNARRINEEAVCELFRQMRLRSLSGMVLTDLINMEETRDREEVLALARELAKAERVKTEAVDITPLGILEVIREKSGPTLRQAISL